MSQNAVLTVVRYQDPAVAGQWLCDAFDFVIHHVSKNPAGEIAYLVLRFADHFILVRGLDGSNFDALLVQPADIGNRSTQICYLTPPSVGEHFERAEQAGAHIELPLSDDEDGGRFYLARDPEGHLWCFGQPPNDLGLLPTYAVASNNDVSDRVASGLKRPPFSRGWIAGAVTLLMAGLGLGYAAGGQPLEANKLAKAERAAANLKTELTSTQQRIALVVREGNDKEQQLLQQVASKQAALDAAALKISQAQAQRKKMRGEIEAFRRARDKAVKDKDKTERQLLDRMASKQTALDAAARNAAQTHGQLARARRELEKLKGAHNKAVKGKENSERQLLKRMASKQAALDAAARKVTQAQAKVTEAKAELVRVRGQAEEFRGARDKANQKLSALQSQVAALTKEGVRLEAKVNTSSKVKAEADVAVSAANARAAVALQKAARLRKELRNNATKFKRQLSDKARVLADSKRTKAKISSELKQAIKQADEARGSYQKTANKLAKLRKKVAALEQETNRLRAQTTQLSEAKAKADKEIEVARRALVAAYSSDPELRKKLQTINVAPVVEKKTSRRRRSGRVRRRSRPTRARRAGTRERRARSRTKQSESNPPQEEYLSPIPRDKKRRHELLGALFDCAGTPNCD